MCAWRCMSFSKKRKEPGCCPHTPHPTHPPLPRPITGDAVEGCVRCFKGWHTQTGRVNWGIVNLTHLFSSRLSHMKPLKPNYCYSGSLLSFVPSLHSDGHTSRQWRRRRYWKRRYERLSSHASITSASASRCIRRRRSGPRRRECSRSVSQSPIPRTRKESSTHLHYFSNCSLWFMFRVSSLTLWFCLSCSFGSVEHGQRAAAEQPWWVSFRENEKHLINFAPTPPGFISQAENLHFCRGLFSLSASIMPLATFQFTKSFDPTNFTLCILLFSLWKATGRLYLGFSVFTEELFPRWRVCVSSLSLWS